jgi:hypothetical protein
VEQAAEDHGHLLLGYFAGSEQFLQAEVRETMVGDAGWKEFAQLTRRDWAEKANLFEYGTLESIFENGWCEHPA